MLNTQRLCSNTTSSHVRSCWVKVEQQSYPPAVWTGSWWTLVSVPSSSAGRCGGESGWRCTSLQLNQHSTGQTRFQTSGRTLDSPGRENTSEEQNTNSSARIHPKTSLGCTNSHQITLLGSMPLTCRSWSSVHCDLLVKEEDPWNCFTLVRDTWAGFLFVTVETIKAQFQFTTSFAMQTHFERCAASFHVNIGLPKI